MAKTVKAIAQTETGRNTRFKDMKTGEEMTRPQFVKEIKNGTYADDYCVRKINGLDTPVSKPDGNKNNNLG